MSVDFVPNRSSHGCLTCKQRRKKCDETKPVCERCVSGGFLCLGYVPKLYTSARRKGTLLTERGTRENNAIALNRANIYIRAASPKIPQLQTHSLEDLLPFVVFQYNRLSRRMFRPFSFPIEDGVKRRLENSEITRWTTLMSAKIVEATFDGTSYKPYVGMIDRFYGQLLVASHTTAHSLISRLSGLQDLSFFTHLVSNSALGYSMFKNCAPLVVQIAAEHPHLWAQNSKISLPAMLEHIAYELPRFAYCDTIYALTFGVTPLLQYDTDTPAQVMNPFRFSILEWMYGCPVDIIIPLAKVNSWRVSQWILQDSVNAGYEQWRRIEAGLQQWSPTVEYIDEASNNIARLAIYEACRQAALIYLYMGMCGVNSADPRVETCVHQIIQLAGTIQAGSSLELYLFLPCLIAGVAARQEKHRAILHGKVSASCNKNMWILRGTDFLPVLEDLWHGIGAGGHPTSWDDYVQSRCTALPLS